jgi:hypothetical protein
LDEQDRAGDLVMGGVRKHQDFARSLAGISPKTLSARLKSWRKPH